MERPRHPLTRPEWLRLAVRHLRPLFADLDRRPSGRTVVHCEQVEGSKCFEIGWCWHFGGVCYIGVSPQLDDPIEVLAVLLHEMTHSAAGPMTMHNGAFRRLVRELGFVGLPTQAVPGEELRARLAAVAAQLGPWPS